MKMLTLNTRSLMEENYEHKLRVFLDFVIQEQPDLMALQEVNQSVDAPIADRDGLNRLVRTKESAIEIRCDNHALKIADALEGAGISFEWTWLPVKLGYGRYDEGMAMFRLNGTITELDVLNISNCSDYNNWKTRKALGVRIDGRDDWFFNVHMGWWADAEEPFIGQWESLQRGLAARRRVTPVWLLGDFNSPVEVRGEGYDLIRDDGWRDTWLLAGNAERGVTVEGRIDGWRDQLNGPEKPRGMRIDHIWCSIYEEILSSRVVFNGENEQQVSDHYGVLLETKGVTV